MRFNRLGVTLVATAVLAKLTEAYDRALRLFIIAFSDGFRSFLVFSGDERFVARLVLVHHLCRFLLWEAHGGVVRRVIIRSLIDISLRLDIS